MTESLTYGSLTVLSAALGSGGISTCSKYSFLVTIPYHELFFATYTMLSSGFKVLSFLALFMLRATALCAMNCPDMATRRDKDDIFIIIIVVLFFTSLI